MFNMNSQKEAPIKKLLIFLFVFSLDVVLNSFQELTISKDLIVKNTLNFIVLLVWDKKGLVHNKEYYVVQFHFVVLGNYLFQIRIGKDFV